MKKLRFRPPKLKIPSSEDGIIILKEVGGVLFLIIMITVLIINITGDDESTPGTGGGVAGTPGTGGGVAGTPGTDTVDTPGTDTVDTSGTDTVDTSGAGTVDTSGAGTVDTSGAGTVDTPGAGTVDTSGAGTVDTSGAGTVDTPVETIPTSIRLSLTLDGSISDISDDFDSIFISHIARILDIEPSRIIINSKEGGSIVVTFSIKSDVDGNIFDIETLRDTLVGDITIDGKSGVWDTPIIITEEEEGLCRDINCIEEGYSMNNDGTYIMDGDSTSECCNGILCSSITCPDGKKHNHSSYYLEGEDGEKVCCSPCPRIRNALDMAEYICDEHSNRIDISPCRASVVRSQTATQECSSGESPAECSTIIPTGGSIGDCSWRPNPCEEGYYKHSSDTVDTCVLCPGSPSTTNPIENTSIESCDPADPTDTSVTCSGFVASSASTVEAINQARESCPSNCIYTEPTLFSCKVDGQTRIDRCRVGYHIVDNPGGNMSCEQNTECGQNRRVASPGVIPGIEDVNCELCPGHPDTANPIANTVMESCDPIDTSGTCSGFVAANDFTVEAINQARESCPSNCVYTEPTIFSCNVGEGTRIDKCEDGYYIDTPGNPEEHDECSVCSAITISDLSGVTNDLVNLQAWGMLESEISCDQSGYSYFTGTGTTRLDPCPHGYYMQITPWYVGRTQSDMCMQCTPIAGMLSGNQVTCEGNNDGQQVRSRIIPSAGDYCLPGYLYIRGSSIYDDRCEQIICNAEEREVLDEYGYIIGCENCDPIENAASETVLECSSCPSELVAATSGGEPVLMADILQQVEDGSYTPPLGRCNSILKHVPAGHTELEECADTWSHQCREWSWVGGPSESGCEFPDGMKEVDRTQEACEANLPSDEVASRSAAKEAGLGAANPLCVWTEGKQPSDCCTPPVDSSKTSSYMEMKVPENVNNQFSTCWCPGTEPTTDYLGANMAELNPNPSSAHSSTPADGWIKFIREPKITNLGTEAERGMCTGEFNLELQERMNHPGRRWPGGYLSDVIRFAEANNWNTCHNELRNRGLTCCTSERAPDDYHMPWGESGWGAQNNNDILKECCSHEETRLSDEWFDATGGGSGKGGFISNTPVRFQEIHDNLVFDLMAADPGLTSAQAEGIANEYTANTMEFVDSSPALKTGGVCSRYLSEEELGIAAIQDAASALSGTSAVGSGTQPAAAAAVGSGTQPAIVLELATAAASAAVGSGTQPAIVLEVATSGGKVALPGQEAAVAADAAAAAAVACVDDADWSATHSEFGTELSDSHTERNCASYAAGQSNHGYCTDKGTDASGAQMVSANDACRVSCGTCGSSSAVDHVLPKEETPRTAHIFTPLVLPSGNANSPIPTPEGCMYIHADEAASAFGAQIVANPRGRCITHAGEADCNDEVYRGIYDGRFEEMTTVGADGQPTPILDGDGYAIQILSPMEEEGEEAYLNSGWYLNDSQPPECIPCPVIENCIEHDCNPPPETDDASSPEPDNYCTKCNPYYHLIDVVTEGGTKKGRACALNRICSSVDKWRGDLEGVDVLNYIDLGLVANDNGDWIGKYPSSDPTAGNHEIGVVDALEHNITKWGVATPDLGSYPDLGGDGIDDVPCNDFSTCGKRQTQVADGENYNFSRIHCRSSNPIYKPLFMLSEHPNQELTTFTDKSEWYPDEAVDPDDYSHVADGTGPPPSRAIRDTRSLKHPNECGIRHDDALPSTDNVIRIYEQRLPEGATSAMQGTRVSTDQIQDWWAAQPGGFIDGAPAEYPIQSILTASPQDAVPALKCSASAYDKVRAQGAPDPTHPLFESQNDSQPGLLSSWSFGGNWDNPTYGLCDPCNTHRFRFLDIDSTNTETTLPFIDPSESYADQEPSWVNPNHHGRHVQILNFPLESEDGLSPGRICEYINDITCVDCIDSTDDRLLNGVHNNSSIKCDNIVNSQLLSPQGQLGIHHSKSPGIYIERCMSTYYKKNAGEVKCVCGELHPEVEGGHPNCQPGGPAVCRYQDLSPTKRSGKCYRRIIGPRPVRGAGDPAPPWRDAGQWEEYLSTPGGDDIKIREDCINPNPPHPTGYEYEWVQEKNDVCIPKTICEEDEYISNDGGFYEDRECVVKEQCAAGEWLNEDADCVPCKKCEVVYGGTKVDGIPCRDSTPNSPGHDTICIDRPKTCGDIFGDGGEQTEGNPVQFQCAYGPAISDNPRDYGNKLLIDRFDSVNEDYVKANEDLCQEAMSDKTTCEGADRECIYTDDGSCESTLNNKYIKEGRINFIKDYLDGVEETDDTQVYHSALRPEDRSKNRSEGYEKDWGIGGDTYTDYQEKLYGVRLDSEFNVKYNPGAVTDIFNLSHESYIKGSGGLCLRQDGVSQPSITDESDCMQLNLDNRYEWTSGNECLRNGVSQPSITTESDCMQLNLNRYYWRKSDRVRGNIHKPDDTRPLNVAQDFCEKDFNTNDNTCLNTYNSGILHQDSEGRVTQRPDSEAWYKEDMESQTGVMLPRLEDWYSNTWRCATLEDCPHIHSSTPPVSLSSEYYTRLPSNDIMNYTLNRLDPSLKTNASKSLWEGGRPLEHLYYVTGVPGAWNPNNELTDFTKDKLYNYSRTYYNAYQALGTEEQLIPKEDNWSSKTTKNEWEILDHTGGGPISLEGSLYFTDATQSSGIQPYSTEASGVENMEIIEGFIGGWNSEDQRAPSKNWEKNLPELVLTGGNMYGSDFSEDVTKTEMMNDMICPEGGCISETCCRARPNECQVSQKMKDIGITDDIFSRTEISTDEHVNAIAHDSCGLCVKEKTRSIIGTCDRTGGLYGEPIYTDHSYILMNDKESCGISEPTDTNTYEAIRAFPPSNIGSDCHGKDAVECQTLGGGQLCSWHTVYGCREDERSCAEECSAADNCKYFSIIGEPSVLQPLSEKEKNNMDECINCRTDGQTVAEQELCSNTQCPKIINNLRDTRVVAEDGVLNVDAEEKTKVKCLLHFSHPPSPPGAAAQDDGHPERHNIFYEEDSTTPSPQPTWVESGQKGGMCFKKLEGQEGTTFDTTTYDESWSCDLTGGIWTPSAGFCLGDISNYKVSNNRTKDLCLSVDADSSCTFSDTPTPSCTPSEECHYKKINKGDMKKEFNKYKNFARDESECGFCSYPEYIYGEDNYISVKYTDIMPYSDVSNSGVNQCTDINDITGLWTNLKWISTMEEAGGIDWEYDNPHTVDEMWRIDAREDLHETNKRCIGGGAQDNICEMYNDPNSPQVLRELSRNSCIGDLNPEDHRPTFLHDDPSILTTTCPQILWDGRRMSDGTVEEGPIYQMQQGSYSTIVDAQNAAQRACEDMGPECTYNTDLLYNPESQDYKDIMAIGCNSRHGCMYSGECISSDPASTLIFSERNEYDCIKNHTEINDDGTYNNLSEWRNTGKCISSKIGMCNDQGMKGMSHILGSLKGLPGKENVGRSGECGRPLVRDGSGMPDTSKSCLGLYGKKIGAITTDDNIGDCKNNESCLYSYAKNKDECESGSYYGDELYQYEYLTSVLNDNTKIITKIKEVNTNIGGSVESHVEGGDRYNVVHPARSSIDSECYDYPIDNFPINSDVDNSVFVPPPEPGDPTKEDYDWPMIMWTAPSTSTFIRAGTRAPNGNNAYFDLEDAKADCAENNECNSVVHRADKAGHPPDFGWSANMAPYYLSNATEEQRLQEALAGGTNTQGAVFALLQQWKSPFMWRTYMKEKRAGGNGISAIDAWGSCGEDPQPADSICRDPWIISQEKDVYIQGIGNYGDGADLGNRKTQSRLWSRDFYKGAMNYNEFIDPATFSSGRMDCEWGADVANFKSGAIWPSSQCQLPEKETLLNVWNKNHPVSEFKMEQRRILFFNDSKCISNDEGAAHGGEWVNGEAPAEGINCNERYPQIPDSVEPRMYEWAVSSSDRATPVPVSQTPPLERKEWLGPTGLTCSRPWAEHAPFDNYGRGCSNGAPCPESGICAGYFASIQGEKDSSSYQDQLFNSVSGLPPTIPEPKECIIMNNTCANENIHDWGNPGSGNYQDIADGIYPSCYDDICDVNPIRWPSAAQHQRPPWIGINLININNPIEDSVYAKEWIGYKPNINRSSMQDSDPVNITCDNLTERTKYLLKCLLIWEYIDSKYIAPNRVDFRVEGGKKHILPENNDIYISGLKWTSFYIKKDDNSKILFANPEDITGSEFLPETQSPAAPLTQSYWDSIRGDWIFEAMDKDARYIVDNMDHNDIIKDLNKYFPEMRRVHIPLGSNHDKPEELRKMYVSTRYRTPIALNKWGEALLKDPLNKSSLPTFMDVSQRRQRDDGNHIIPLDPEDITDKLFPCNIYKAGDTGNQLISDIDPDEFRKYILNNNGQFSNITSDNDLLYNPDDACCGCLNINNFSGKGGINEELRKWKWIPGVWHGQWNEKGGEYTDKEIDAFECHLNGTCQEIYDDLENSPKSEEGAGFRVLDNDDQDSLGNWTGSPAHETESNINLHYDSLYDYQEHEYLDETKPGIIGCINPITDEIWSVHEDDGGDVPLCIWSGIRGMEDYPPTYAEKIQKPSENRPYRQDEYPYNECREISNEIAENIDRSGCHRSEPGDEYSIGSDWCGDDKGICVRFLKIQGEDGGWSIEGDYGEYLGGAGGGGYGSDPGFENEKECLSHPWCTGIWGSLSEIDEESEFLKSENIHNLDISNGTGIGNVQPDIGKEPSQTVQSETHGRNRDMFNNPYRHNYEGGGGLRDEGEGYTSEAGIVVSDYMGPSSDYNPLTFPDSPETDAPQEVFQEGSAPWSWGCKWVKNPGSSRVRHSEEFNLLMEKCVQHGTCRWNPICSEDPQDYRWDSITSNWVPSVEKMAQLAQKQSSDPNYRHISNEYDIYGRPIPLAGKGGYGGIKVYQNYETIHGGSDGISNHKYVIHVHEPSFSGGLDIYSDGHGTYAPGWRDGHWSWPGTKPGLLGLYPSAVCSGSGRNEGVGSLDCHFTEMGHPEEGILPPWERAWGGGAFPAQVESLSPGQANLDIVVPEPLQQMVELGGPMWPDPIFLTDPNGAQYATYIPPVAPVLDDGGNLVGIRDTEAGDTVSVLGEILNDMHPSKTERLTRDEWMVAKGILEPNSGKCHWVDKITGEYHKNVGTDTEGLMMYCPGNWPDPMVDPIPNDGYLDIYPEWTDREGLKDLSNNPNWTWLSGIWDENLTTEYQYNPSSWRAGLFHDSPLPNPPEEVYNRNVIVYEPLDNQRCLTNPNGPTYPTLTMAKEACDQEDTCYGVLDEYCANNECDSIAAMVPSATISQEEIDTISWYCNQRKFKLCLDDWAGRRMYPSVYGHCVHEKSLTSDDTSTTPMYHTPAGLGEAAGMGDSTFFGYTQGGMKHYENRLLWEVTDSELSSYDPILRERIINKRHGESMMEWTLNSGTNHPEPYYNICSGVDERECIKRGCEWGGGVCLPSSTTIESKGPTTRHWDTQTHPEAYGAWKNCCIPESRGIWQKDLPPVPVSKGRVWEGTGSSKRRRENESGWELDSHSKGIVSGKDYIPRSCDIISADAYDTFRDGHKGIGIAGEIGTSEGYRYGMDKGLGTLFTEGTWYENWNTGDVDYESSRDRTVDYNDPSGTDSRRIWESEYNGRCFVELSDGELHDQLCCSPDYSDEVASSVLESCKSEDPDETCSGFVPARNFTTSEITTARSTCPSQCVYDPPQSHSCVKNKYCEKEMDCINAHKDSIIQMEQIVDIIPDDDHEGKQAATIQGQQWSASTAIWHPPEKSLENDLERFRRECINADCMWLTEGASTDLMGGGQCVDIITLTGIITFEHIGTSINPVDGQDTSIVDAVLPEPNVTSELMDSFPVWQEGKTIQELQAASSLCTLRAEEWRYLQLDTLPGRSDRGWYFDIERSIKTMIKTFFESNGIEVEYNDIIIENNLVNKIDSQTNSDLMGNIYEFNKSSGSVMDETIINNGNIYEEINNHYSSVCYGGYNTINNKHPISYKIKVACNNTVSTEECIEEYKEVQKKFTYNCENGYQNIITTRKGVFTSLLPSHYKGEKDFPLDIYAGAGTKHLVGDTSTLIPPTVKWLTTNTPASIKTCSMVNHNCKYHEKNIKLGITPKGVVNTGTICSGTIDGANEQQELCSDDDCCTRDVVYCHEGENIDDIEGRYNKSLDVTDTDGNKIVGSITLNEYNNNGNPAGIPRSGLTPEETAEKREQYYTLYNELYAIDSSVARQDQTEAETNASKASAINFKTFIKDNGVCRNATDPGFPTDSRSVKDDSDISCAWDLGYTHVGGLVLGNNRWSGINEPLSSTDGKRGCPTQSSSWDDMDQSDIISSQWRAGTDNGVEYEGGYCALNKEGDLPESVNQIRTLLNYSKSQCLDPATTLADIPWDPIYDTGHMSGARVGLRRGSDDYKKCSSPIINMGSILIAGSSVGGAFVHEDGEPCPDGTIQIMDEENCFAAQDLSGPLNALGRGLHVSEDHDNVYPADDEHRVGSWSNIVEGCFIAPEMSDDPAEFHHQFGYGNTTIHFNKNPEETGEDKLKGKRVCVDVEMTGDSTPLGCNLVWNHGPILCEAVNNESDNTIIYDGDGTDLGSIKYPAIHTGTQDEMCSNASAINNDYIVKAASCKARTRIPGFDHDETVCNSINHNMAAIIGDLGQDEGNKVSNKELLRDLKSACENASASIHDGAPPEHTVDCGCTDMTSSLGVPTIDCLGNNDPLGKILSQAECSLLSAEDLTDRLNNGICIMEDEAYNVIGTLPDDKCQLGICSPTDCFDTSTNNYREDCKVKIGKHISEPDTIHLPNSKHNYFTTYDYETYDYGITEDNLGNKVMGMYATCETEEYDCSKSLKDSSEIYASDNKECLNYIMRSPNWSGGGDSINSMGYLKDTHLITALKNIEGKCSDERFNTISDCVTHSGTWTPGPDRLEEEFAYLSGCDGIPTEPEPKEIRMRQPCKALSQTLSERFNSIPTAFKDEPRCFDEDRLLLDKLDERNYLDLLIPNSCCKKFKDVDCDNYEGGGLCFEVPVSDNWDDEGKLAVLVPEIKTKRDCISPDGSSTYLLWASGCSKRKLPSPHADDPAAQHQADGNFWEKLHPPRMIYETDTWLQNEGSEDWMTEDFLRDFNTFMAEQRDDLRQQLEDYDTWRPGPCNFACANYRTTYPNNEAIPEQTPGICESGSCKPPTFNWGQPIQLKSDGGSTTIAEEMREMCNICLASGTIE